jgi:SNF2 family DNA or RNA helicase
MAKLLISINENNSIEISLIGSFTSKDCDSVNSWWGDSSRYSNVDKKIEVPIADFILKMHWLREMWTRVGHTVEFTDKAKTIIKNSQNLSLEFDKFALADGSNFEIDETFLTLKRPLKPFQVSNLRALLKVPNGANFSVPGAGKTSTALAVWNYLNNKNLLTRLLIICPRSAFEAWRDEPNIVIGRHVIVNQFTEESIPPDTEILYVNYEQLESPERLSRIIRWVSQEFTMLVIDEAHRIKSGPASVRWRACQEIGSKAKRIDLLTGTPMPQSPQDLKNLFSLSWPGIPKSFFSDQKLASLRRGGIFVRTTKNELNLPPMVITPVNIPMGKIQSEIYLALRRSFVGRFGLSDIDRNYFGQKGKAVMTLIAAATNPGLLLGSSNEDAYLGLLWPPQELSGSERLMEILNKYVQHEIPPKYEWVIKFISKAASEGRKVLVWSTFIGNLVALKKLLSPYNPAMIYGGTSQEDRILELKRFRTSSDCSVLLSNPQTLGEGVSLHNECHDAIYLDRSYNAGLYLQSLDRIHRLGLPLSQETSVFILNTEGTVDLRIGKRLATKIDLLGSFLNDEGLVEVSLPSTEESETPEAILGLDDFDVNDLFEHLRIDK